MMNFWCEPGTFEPRGRELAPLHRLTVVAPVVAKPAAPVDAPVAVAVVDPIGAVTAAGGVVAQPADAVM